jgi:hypothetical protein
MKKNMMVLACMSTAFMHGMETTTNTLDFPIHQTIIRLTKGSMYDVDKVDFIAVGRVQQRTLQAPNFGDLYTVGLISKVPNNMVYIKHKDDDSASDDDTYKPYDNAELEKKELWKRADKKVMQSRVLSVIEPRIRMKDFKDWQTWSYYAERIHSSSMVDLNSRNKEHVLEEAKKDLALCYKNALLEVLRKEKSIAISALGTDVGFPREDAAPVAVAAIIEFIKTSVNDGTEPYELIHLFVKKRSDFARYKELLAQYGVEQK